MKNVAIIVAGGAGKRMGRPKQFLKLAGRPMLEWTLAAFQKAKKVDGIILVVASNQLAAARRLPQAKIIEIVEGGKERQDSVQHGLRELPESAEIVLIHDGARPAVTGAIIDRAIAGAKKWGVVVVGVPVKDTIKEMKNEKCSRFAGSRNNYNNIAEAGQMSNEGVVIKRTINRGKLWSAQTPQAFRAGIIRDAYRRVRGKFTDDAMLVERLGRSVRLIIGSYENIKVTTPEDLRMAGEILKRRRK